MPYTINLDKITISINRNTKRIINMLVEAFKQSAISEADQKIMFGEGEENNRRGWIFGLVQMLESMLDESLDGKEKEIPAAQVTLDAATNRIFKKYAEDLSYLSELDKIQTIKKAEVGTVSEAAYVMVRLMHRLTAFALSREHNMHGKEILDALSKFLSSVNKTDMLNSRSFYRSNELSNFNLFIGKNQQNWFAVFSQAVLAMGKIHSNTNAIKAAQSHLSKLERLLCSRIMVLLNPHQPIASFGNEICQHQYSMRKLMQTLATQAMKNPVAAAGDKNELKLMFHTTNLPPRPLLTSKEQKVEALKRQKLSKTVNKLEDLSDEVNFLYKSPVFQQQILMQYHLYNRNRNPEIIKELFHAWFFTSKLRRYVFDLLDTVNDICGWGWIFLKWIDISSIQKSLNDNFNHVNEVIKKASLNHIENSAPGKIAINNFNLQVPTMALQDFNAANINLSSLQSVEVIRAVMATLRESLQLMRTKSLRIGVSAVKNPDFDYTLPEVENSVKAIEDKKSDAIPQDDVDILDDHIIEQLILHYFGERMWYHSTGQRERAAFNLRKQLLREWKANIENRLVKFVSDVKNPPAEFAQVFSPLLKTNGGKIMRDTTFGCVEIRDDLPNSMRAFHGKVIHKIFQNIHLLSRAYKTELTKILTQFAGFQIKEYGERPDIYFGDQQKIISALKNKKLISESALTVPPIRLKSDVKLDLDSKYALSTKLNPIVKQIANNIWGTRRPSGSLLPAESYIARRVQNHFKKHIATIFQSSQGVLLKILRYAASKKHDDMNAKKDYAIQLLCKYGINFISMKKNGEENSRDSTLLSFIRNYQNPNRDFAIDGALKILYLSLRLGNEMGPTTLQAIFSTSVNIDKEELNRISDMMRDFLGCEFTQSGNLDITDAVKRFEHYNPDFNHFVIPHFMHTGWGSKNIASKPKMTLFLSAKKRDRKQEAKVSLKSIDQKTVDLQRRSETLADMIARVKDKYFKQFRLNNPNQRKSIVSLNNIMSSNGGIGNLMCYLLAGKGAWRTSKGNKSLKVMLLNELSVKVNDYSVKGNSYTREDIRRFFTNYILRFEFGISGNNIGNYHKLRDYIFDVVEKAFHIAGERRLFSYSAILGADIGLSKANNLIQGLIDLKLDVENYGKHTIKHLIEKGCDQSDILKVMQFQYTIAEKSKRDYKELEISSQYFRTVFQSRSCMGPHMPDSSKKLRIRSV